MAILAKMSKKRLIIIELKREVGERGGGGDGKVGGFK